MPDPSSQNNPQPDSPQPAAPTRAAATPEDSDLPQYRIDREYTAADLQHLTDLEHVRERPSMYIGDTAVRGLHHLVYEVVDNSIDEAMAGYAKNISVTINVDGSVTVEDDGRGIPGRKMHPDLGFSTLEGVMTVLKFGGKFQKGAYQTSGGSARRGRDRGELPLRMVRGAKSAATGTSISRNTSAACRTGDVRTHRQHDQDRHEDHVQARPADLPQHASSTTTRCTAGCRSWRSSTAA